MYREAAEPDAVERPPAELVYEAFDRSASKGPALALLQSLAMPGVVAAALATFAGPTAGLAGLLGSGAFGIWWWRRTAKAGIVLRVDAGTVVVSQRARRARPTSFRLADLASVELDTKTIRLVEDGSNAVPGLRFAERVGPEVEKSRIVLVLREGRRVPLSDAHVAHMDATEWLGKIRVFFRKHGWVPASERVEADDD